jgi:2-keto-3-deoxy-6-phosphogluconate aldolase
MVQLQLAIFGRVMIPWAQILLIINFSITQALDNYKPWKRTPILPVIHNLETFQVPTIIDALDGIKCCTVSLRHANAMLSLKELTEQFGPYCDVGVSTVVSTNQVCDSTFL